MTAPLRKTPSGIASHHGSPITVPVDARPKAASIASHRAAAAATVRAADCTGPGSAREPVSEP